MKKSYILIGLFLFVQMTFAQENNKDDYPTTPYHFFYNFENPAPYLYVDSSAQNIWQTGVPNKTHFDSAFSVPNAIVTDTVSGYAPNKHSWFDLYVGKFSFKDSFNSYFPYSIVFKIKHRFDTDSLKDGGYITVSWDNGKTWMNAIHDTVYPWDSPGPYFDLKELMYFEHPAFKLFNGEYGFTGNSGGWWTTTFYWHLHIVKGFNPDTMIVRFNFISDSIDNNKDGWIIDDIKCYSYIDGAVNENEGQGFLFYPNPLKSSATIELKRTYGDIELMLYDINGKLMDRQHYVGKKTIRYDNPSLKAGVYLLQLKLDNNQTLSKKVQILD